MKPILLAGLCMLLVIPMSLATFEIDDIKGYVNDERISGVDTDGGTFPVKLMDNVYVKLTLVNTFNTSMQVKIKLNVDGIDDGSDINKEISSFTMDADSDVSKQISFGVPETASTDTYDMELRIYYTYNGTENLTTKEYDVWVKKDTVDNTLNLYSSFSNLTDVCRNVTQNIAMFVGYVDKYNECNNQLSTVKEERGTYKSQLEERTSTLTACQNDKTNLENEKTSMITLAEHQRLQSEAVQLQIDIAKKDSDGKDQMMLAMAGAAVVGYWYMNKKKQTSSVQGQYYYEKK